MTFRRLFLIVFTATLSLSLVGCDLTGSNETGSNAPATTSGVFVANQGNFGDGNGSLSIYNPIAERSTPEAITGLNSIVQSIKVRNDKLYLAANTGARLDIFSISNLNLTGQATEDLSSPRYIAFPGNGTAYVSNLSDNNNISVVDLNSNSVTSTISTSGSPEGLTTTDNRVYAALGVFSRSSKVAVLDPSTASLKSEVDIGCTSRFVLADNQDEVFALCNNETTGEAVILDGTEETARLELPDSVKTAGPGQGAYYSEAAQELYVVLDEEQVIRINTATNEKGPTFTPPGDGNIGAIGYDAIDQRLYVGRADPSAPFTAAGTVTIHNRDGERTGDFTAGISPTYIDFRRVDE